MEQHKKIRLIVRETLNEIAMAIGGSGWDSNNDLHSFHGYPSGYGQFPYLYTDIPEMLASADEVNKNNEHIRVQKYTRNNEVYDFPFEAFKKGYEIEKKELENKNQILNVYDIAREVIENLRNDKNFYQNENAGNTSQ